MPSSLASRKRKLQQAAGPLAKPSVWITKGGTPRVLITCRDCANRHGSWRSRSDGEATGPGSTINFALDLWADHLETVHHQTCPWSTTEWRGATLTDHA